MFIVANLDEQIQYNPAHYNLSNLEKRVVLFLNYFAKKFHNHVTVGIDNIANWIGRSRRTAFMVLKSLIDKGLIERQRRGKGNHALTKITGKGFDLVLQLDEKQTKIINNNAESNSANQQVAHQNEAPIDPAAPQIAPQTAPQNELYLRSINHKGSKIPLDLGMSAMVEKKEIQLPKALDAKFSRKATKVLSEITCTLREKVIAEFDAYAARETVHSPIAFLRHKINQFSNKNFVMKENITAEERIAKQKLKNDLQDQALQMAKNELKRQGIGYPANDFTKSIGEHFDELRAYGVKESEFYLRFLCELEVKHGLRQVGNPN